MQAWDEQLISFSPEGEAWFFKRITRPGKRTEKITVYPCFQIDLSKRTVVSKAPVFRGELLALGRVLRPKQSVSIKGASDYMCLYSNSDLRMGSGEFFAYV